MEEKIKSYVTELFENAPKTKNTVELRQEIYTNLIDKYNDLITNGATQSEAYNIVLNSIGDINELLKVDTKEPAEENTKRKKYALLSSIAIALYILSPLPVIILGVYGNPIIGVVLLFILVALATGIVVYCSANKPSYEKMDDTLVEEFKEWKDENKNRIDKKNAYTGAIWALIVALYFIISFLTGAWFITWVIFIIGGAIEKIISINIK